MLRPAQESDTAILLVMTIIETLESPSRTSRNQRDVVDLLALVRFFLQLCGCSFCRPLSAQIR